MVPKPPQIPFEKKNSKTERQKRLGAALRKNLSKRKLQTRERQESTSATETEGQPES